jgi:hypothetical protein
MSGLVQKLAQFARSPKGQKLAGQAKEAAAKPENRRKIEELRQRISRRRG